MRGDLHADGQSLAGGPGAHEGAGPARQVEGHGVGSGCAIECLMRRRRCHVHRTDDRVQLGEDAQARVFRTSLPRTERALSACGGFRIAGPVFSCNHWKRLKKYQALKKITDTFDIWASYGKNIKQ